MVQFLVFAFFLLCLTSSLKSASFLAVIGPWFEHQILLQSDGNSNSILSFGANLSPIIPHNQMHYPHQVSRASTAFAEPPPSILKFGVSAVPASCSKRHIRPISVNLNLIFLFGESAWVLVAPCVAISF